MCESHKSDSDARTDVPSAERENQDLGAEDGHARGGGNPERRMAGIKAAPFVLGLPTTWHPSCRNSHPALWRSLRPFFLSPAARPVSPAVSSVRRVNQQHLTTLVITNPLAQSPHNTSK